MSRKIEKDLLSIGADGAAACCRPWSAPANPLRRVVDNLLRWQAREAERAHLLSLPDYLLRDMGLSRDEVEATTATPFWKVFLR